MNFDEVGTERPPTPCVLNVLGQRACGEARLVSRHLEVNEERLRDHVLDRHETGNLTLRPEAVFG